MGGSSSDDDKERGTLNRLEPPEKIPRSNEGPQGENWTRVDLIVDSGASDSTLPFGVLPDHENGEARGYKEFSMADGRSLLNLGTKKLQMAFQCGRIMTGTFSVVDISKPLLSMGKLVSMGKEEVSLVHCRQETAIRNLFARTIWVLIPKPQCIGTISQENHLRQKRLKRQEQRRSV